METGKVDSGASSSSQDEAREWIIVEETNNLSGEWMVVTEGMNAFSMIRHKPETTSAANVVVEVPSRVGKRSHTEEEAPPKERPAIGSGTKSDNNPRRELQIYSQAQLSTNKSARCDPSGDRALESLQWFCWICQDTTACESKKDTKTTFGSEKSIWKHFQKEHPTEIPSLDQEKVAKFTRILAGLEPTPTNNSPVRYLAPEERQILDQPQTRPISQEQLVAEVKGIYAGLVMVEGKCIQVDQKQMALARASDPGTQLKLNIEQWQALIALHRTLLHEHHDFFLASQHPSASPALRRLAAKYAMPARLWRHGIHSFLELLRNRLPDSLDHMLTFLYLAYSMMALLYETVPAFEETWAECLGDLARYRMAIEEEDIRDREVWTEVSKQWYLQLSDTQPATGRLHHHLAILARPNAFQQLFLYGKALSVPKPFTAARESILTLFRPLDAKQSERCSPVAMAYVKVNAILFLHENREDFGPSCVGFTSLLKRHISFAAQDFLEQGYCIAISNITALLSFGSPENILVSMVSGRAIPETTLGSTATEDVLMFEESRNLFNDTISIVLQRTEDPNILPFLHVVMVFVEYMSGFPSAMKLLRNGFPLTNLIVMLNTLVCAHHTYEHTEQDDRPQPDIDDFRLYPEEVAMRGLFWTSQYFPEGWFLNKSVDGENLYEEEILMNRNYRRRMILWLAVRFARAGDWIGFDQVEKSFSMRSQIGDRDLESTSASVIAEDAHDENIRLGSQICGLSIRTSDSLSIVMKTG